MAQFKREKKGDTKGEADHFMTTKGNGKLMLYNAFPRNYSTMAEATADLDRIRLLGFNAVWINPLTATSDFTVSRFNIIRLEEQRVQGSLYAASDFSQLNSRMFPDLANSEHEPLPATGNPGESSEHEKKMLSAYTDKARENGMQPIFDLVLNHVACDSPLVRGECPYFKRTRIDTRTWFQDNDPDWDDVILFNYADPSIRSEIIRELWFPYITKYINDFGFGGIRMDFAGGRPEVELVERAVCDEIKRLVAAKGEEAIIFAELLPPEKVLLRNIRDLRELYTYVTNATFLDPENSGPERKLKQQVTHLKLGQDDVSRLHPGGGTVGFASSHDEGPNIRNSLKEIAAATIQADPLKKPLFDSASKKQKKKMLEQSITELVDVALKDKEKMADVHLEQGRRLALCALLSDGGFYLLGGDEYGRITPASVFIDEMGRPMYDDTTMFNEAKKSPFHHDALIKNLNAALADMPRSTFPHWSQSLHLPKPHDKLVVVMNYNGDGFSDPSPVLSIVNLSNSIVKVSDDLIRQIAEESMNQNQAGEQVYQAILRAKIQLIGHFETTLAPGKISFYDHEDDPKPESTFNGKRTPSPCHEAAAQKSNDKHHHFGLTNALQTRISLPIKGTVHNQVEVLFQIPATLLEQLKPIIIEHAKEIQEGEFESTVLKLKQLCPMFHQNADVLHAIDEIEKSIDVVDSPIQRAIIAILDRTTTHSPGP